MTGEEERQFQAPLAQRIRSIDFNRRVAAAVALDSTDLQFQWGPLHRVITPSDSIDDIGEMFGISRMTLYR